MNSVKISIKLPERWQELTDNQLHYVYSLMADNLSTEQIKVYCLFRWTGLKVVGPYGSGWEVRQGTARGYIEPGLIKAAVGVLDWLDTIPDTPVRLSRIKNHYAIDATLQNPDFEGWSSQEQSQHRFDFGKYLYCDNLYQGFLSTQKHELLVQMAELLYDTEGIRINQTEKISIFYWWAGLKSLFSRTFIHFLQPMGAEEVIDGGAPLAAKLQEATNAQIRALTGGDVTKRKEVLALDVWSAMWELDAKAKENIEWERKYGK